MSKFIIMTKLDEMLIEYGFNKMPLYDKTRLITQISNSSGKEHTEITEEDVLNYHKELKRNILNKKCEDEILKGFLSDNGHYYRTNRDDQINMIGQKDRLDKDESILNVYWKTEDEGYIEHTRDEWLEVYSEAFEYKKNNLFKYDTLRTSVMQSQTHEEILEINWDESIEEEQTEETE